MQISSTQQYRIKDLSMFTNFLLLGARINVLRSKIERYNLGLVVGFFVINLALIRLFRILDLSACHSMATAMLLLTVSLKTFAVKRALCFGHSWAEHPSFYLNRAQMCLRPLWHNIYPSSFTR